MSAGGLTGAGGSLAGTTPPPLPKQPDSSALISYANAGAPRADGPKPESKDGKPGADAKGGHDAWAQTEEQSQKLQDFDAVRGRPSFDDGRQGNGSGNARSDADMRARVETYQQDFDRTVDAKIADIDKKVASIDRRLEGNMFGKAEAVTRPAAEARKDALLQERANLKNLADGSDAGRQAKFETYQRHFDQAVDDKIDQVDDEIADIDRKLDRLPTTGMGSVRGARPHLQVKREELLQQRADLQTVADDPDAALKTLKAQHARDNGSDGWSASDVGHLALDVVGLAPVVGEWADGLNAAWYFSEGNIVDGGLSMMATAPGAGILATVGKWFGKGAKSADDVVGAIKGPKGPDAPSGKPETQDAEKTEGAGKSASRPQIQIEHILDGEINKNGKAVGYHHRADGADASNARMTQQTKPSDVNDVYAGKVEVRDPSTGQWVTKKADSTFYPDKLSRLEVTEAIENAWDNKTAFDRSTGRFEGPSGQGFNIVGFARDGEIKTAYPDRMR